MPVVRRREAFIPKPKPVTLAERIQQEGTGHKDLKNVPTEQLTKNDWNKLWEAVERSVAVGREVRDSKVRNVGSLYSKDGVNLTGRFCLPNSEEKINVIGKISKDLVDGRETMVVTLAPVGSPSKQTEFESSGQRSFRGTWPWSTSYEELTITFLRQGNSRDSRTGRVAIVRSRSL